MKRFIFSIALFTVLNIFAFSQESDSVQEEIDYLLFVPNSSNKFADEARAKTQLDNIARYLKSKNLIDAQAAEGGDVLSNSLSSPTAGRHAQIYVYGYTADVANDIDSNQLSIDRARYVINELQQRGIAGRFFAIPVGYGSVNLWGNNANENSRSPNRRVRILFEDIIITPEVLYDSQAEEEAELVNRDESEILAFEDMDYFDSYESYDYYEDFYEDFYDESALTQDSDKFDWWWLLLLLLPLFLLIWPKRKVKKSKVIKEAAAQPKPAFTPQIIAEFPAQVEPTIAPKAVVETPVPQAIVEDHPIPLAAAAPVSVAAPAAGSTAKAVTSVSEPVADTALVRPAGGEPKYYRLTEEEIQNLAYKLYEQRSHEHGYHDQDWLNAIGQLFAKYEAQGYIVLWP